MTRFAILAAGVLAGTAMALAPLTDDPVEFAGPPRSATPNLATGPDGTVVLTWLEPVADQSWALRFSTRNPGGGWSAPGTVHRSDRFFVNWADFPSVTVLADGAWLVHWLEKTIAKPYAYHVQLALSTDRGRSWSPAFRAHRDSSDTEHGFVAVVPRPAGGADLAWLDGQRMDAGGPMTIRTASVTSGGALGREVELDDRTCECCQAALARTSRGLVAAYRDRTTEEIRDIAVVLERDGRWSAPRIPAPDQWEHRACPVNGPALAADGDHLALAWYTGASGRTAVSLIQSRDGGETFGPRTPISEGETMGRVDAIPLGGGAVLVAWLDGVNASEAEWRIRRVAPDGRAGPVRTVTRVSRARLAGFPRLAASGTGEVLFAITATGETGGVRVFNLGRMASRP